MELLDLPLELVFIIARGLDRPSLSRFTRTSQYLRALFTPVLHAQIPAEAGEILLWAAENNHIPTIDLSLSNGALLEATDDKYRTPLHIAAIHDSVQAAQVLISRGANIDHTDGHDCTPLHLAAQNESVAVAYMLLDAGADKNIEDGRSFTPLHHAAKNGNLGVARALLEHRAGINACTYLWETPLHLGISSDSEDVVRLLLDAGADMNICSRSKGRVCLGNTWSDQSGMPLHWAVRAGNDGLVKMLLVYGADVGALDRDMRTVAHIAAMVGGQVARILLPRAGSLRYVKDRDGKTLVDLANLRMGRLC